MNITNNIIYINNDENDYFSRKVGQNIIACNKIANKIENKTNSIEIEFLSDNLNKIPILENDNKQLSQEKEDLKEQINDLVKQNEHLTESADKAVELQQQVNTLTNEKESLSNEVSGLQTRLVEKDSEIITLSNNNSNLQEEVNTLTTEKESLSNEVSGLQTRLVEKDSEIITLSNNNSNLEQQVNTLTTEKEELSESNTNLTVTVNSLQQQVNTLTAENETLRNETGNEQREIYRVDLGFDDATEHSIITRPKFSLESLEFDETLGEQAIWMWNKVKLYGNTYYYELDRYVVSSLEEIRADFEYTLSQDEYVVASTFDTTFIGETKKITSLYLSLPIVNNYAFMIPWMDVTISDSTTALLILSSLQFNPAKSDDPYQNIVGW